jgi:hypothetical protein
MPDQGTVSFTVHTTDQIKAATLTVQAEGIALDDALDLIADGAEAAGYTVTRTQVVETVTRPGRARGPKPEKADPVTVVEGEPARIRRVKVKGGVVDA